MTVRIGCIVEGHGETESVPILIRRIAQQLDPSLHVEIPHPIRISKTRLLQSGELERAVRLAALNVQGDGGILVVLDSDEDCPAQRGPELASRTHSARGDLPSAVVLPKCEFESWFLAAAESLRGCKGLPSDLTPPPNPEEIGGAKEWLAARFPGGTYSSRVDQPSLTSAFDFELARRSPSFDKCYREVTRLLTVLRG